MGRYSLRRALRDLIIFGGLLGLLVLIQQVDPEYLNPLLWAYLLTELF